VNEVTGDLYLFEDNNQRIYTIDEMNRYDDVDI
jgi:hypothetical protein